MAIVVSKDGVDIGEITIQEITMKSELEDDLRLGILINGEPKQSFSVVVSVPISLPADKKIEFMFPIVYPQIMQRLARSKQKEIEVFVDKVRTGVKVNLFTPVKYVCGNCNSTLEQGVVICSNCMRELIWEEVL